MIESQVIPMNEGIPSTISQKLLHLCRTMSDQLQALVRVVTDQTASDNDAFTIANSDEIAASERPFKSRYACGKE